MNAYFCHQKYVWSVNIFQLPDSKVNLGHCFATCITQCNPLLPLLKKILQKTQKLEFNLS